MNKRTYTEQQYQSGVVQYNVASDILHWLRRSATYQTINWKIYYHGTHYNGIKSTKWWLRLNVWQPKITEHQVMATDQSKTCFMLIFDHQNLGINTSCVKISVILAGIWHKIKFSVMAGHVIPVCPFGQLCQSFPPITGCILLFDHQNLGIDTSYMYLEISVILIKQKWNEIWYPVMAEHFTPVYPFRIILTKVSPSRFFAKMLSLFWYQET